MSSSLDVSKKDRAISVGKAIAGAVPYVGPLVQEVIDNLVPNQRVDRIASFTEELDVRLSVVEESQVRNLLDNPSGLALAEDGIIAATRAITPERIKYIASTVARGLTTEDIDANRQRYLLTLLSELNDEEVLWLRFFSVPTISGDQEFREQHGNVFELASAHLGATEAELDKSSIQSSYKRHLERLGLVENHAQVDAETGVPEFDDLSGKIRIYNTSITHLGRMLLREIGMLDGEAADIEKQLELEKQLGL